MKEHISLNHLLSSQQPVSSITQHLLSLPTDELISQLNCAGIASINAGLLKALIVLHAQAELVEEKIKRSIPAKKKPISAEHYRALSVKIQKAYLNSWKNGDAKKLKLDCQIYLREIERLESWPKFANEKYNEEWLKQVKLRIMKYLQSVQLETTEH